jgi:HAD superfamily hydrolase (TIGR01509 family)
VSPVRRVAGLVFDMDGTLFDSSRLVPDSYVEVAASAGRTVTREEVVASYAVGPPTVLLSHLLGRPAEPAQLEAYHEGLRRGASSLRPYPGIVDSLRALAAYAPLAVFTGADRIACSMLLEATGLAPWFRAVVGSDEVAHPKPEPDGIIEACARLGVEVADAAYVGDSGRDLEAARRSGALAVAAAWGHEHRDPSPADVVVRSPGDLLALVA